MKLFLIKCRSCLPLIPFGTLFSVTLSFLCCLYLFLQGYSSCKKDSVFITASLAKSKASADSSHHAISDACILPKDTIQKDTLSAYETCYYCIPWQKEITLTMHSNTIKHLKIVFLSDSGKTLSYSSTLVQAKKLSCRIKTSRKRQYIFLKLTNHSTKQTTVSFLTETQKQTAKNSKKQTSSNSTPTSNPQETVKPKQKTKSLKKKKTTGFSLHFLYLFKDDSQKIPLKGCSLKDKNIECISTNPKTALYKNGKIYALSEGTAIIYLHSKSAASKSSSCLVRVLPK